MRLSLAVVIFFLAVTVPCVAAENPLDKAISEYRAENYEEAMELLLKIRAEQPGNGVAAYYLGLVFKQTGDYKAASDNFRKALETTPPVNDAYVELIEMLYNLGKLDDAREWIVKAEKGGAPPAHISFLKGMVLMKQSDNANAVKSFEQAKKADRTLTQAADLQIAMIYAGENKISEARDSLRAIISVDPSTDIAAFAREYEKTFTELIEQHRTWIVTAGIGYSYDDNVVLKPSSDIPGVNISGEKDSSLIGTFGVIYSPMPSGPWSFNGQYSYYSNTYQETDTHNLMTHTLSLIPGYNRPSAAVTLPLTYSHVWLEEKEYQGIATVAPTLSMVMIPGHIAQISAGYANREMIQSVLDREENRDGDIYLASVGYFYPFSEGKGMFNLKYEYLRDVTKGENWENNGNRVSTSLLIPLSERMRFSIAGEYFLQDYLNTHTVFGEKREDRIASGSATFSWKVYGGLSLNLEYSHTTAVSNIEIYDYDRNVYIAGLEYRF